MNVSGLFPRFKAALRSNKAYSWAVLLPTLLAAVYYGLVATDRYVSSARMIVERDTSSSIPGMDLGILSFGSSQNEIDAWLVTRFIESPAMLDYLDETLKLREHYEDSHIDLVSRLWHSTSRQGYLDYFLAHTEVDVDKDALTIDLVVQGFDPDYSQKLAQAIASRAERFVNDVGQSLAREQVDFVKKEVDQAYARLQTASKELIKFQNEKGLFSPEAENANVSQVISSLQVELAQQRTQMKAYLGYLSSTAPDVVNLQKRISALERQIDQERAKQVRGTGDTALNDLLLAYKEREMEVDIAGDIYQGGLKSLEAAKVDASRKVKHLVMVSSPTLPDRSTEPHRIYMLVTVFVLLNLAYVIGGLIISIIKDHRE